MLSLDRRAAARRRRDARGRAPSRSCRRRRRCATTRTSGSARGGLERLDDAAVHLDGEAVLGLGRSRTIQRTRPSSRTETPLAFRQSSSLPRSFASARGASSLARTRLPRRRASPSLAFIRRLLTHQRLAARTVYCAPAMIVNTAVTIIATCVYARSPTDVERRSTRTSTMRQRSAAPWRTYRCASGASRPAPWRSCQRVENEDADEQHGVAATITARSQIGIARTRTPTRSATRMRSLSAMGSSSAPSRDFWLSSRGRGNRR